MRRPEPIPLLVPLLAGSLLLLGTACNSAGPHAVRTARAPYNEALVRTWNEQLLLNLVRLRYRDTPFFLEVDSLTTQYELSGSASAAADLGRGSEDSYSLGAGAALSESPTVVYKPLQGESFVTQLLEPISLDKVMLLTQSGWSIERVFRLTVNEIADIPNAPSTTGPTPDYEPRYQEFNCLVGLLRELQTDRRLEVLSEPAADRDASGTAGGGYRYSLRLRRGAEGGEEDLRVREGVSRCFGGLEDPQARQVVEALTPDEDRDLLAGDPVATRSLMGALYYLSQAVEIPAEHAELVTATDGWEEMYAGFFAVRTGPVCGSGAAFVRISYRGRPFCILDSDLGSKSTFGLLAQLVSLQAGSEAGALAPRLTLGLD